MVAMSHSHPSPLKFSCFTASDNLFICHVFLSTVFQREIHLHWHPWPMCFLHLFLVMIPYSWRMLPPSVPFPGFFLQSPGSLGWSPFNLHLRSLLQHIAVLASPAHPLLPVLLAWRVCVHGLRSASSQVFLSFHVTPCPLQRGVTHVNSLLFQGIQFCLLTTFSTWRIHCWVLKLNLASKTSRFFNVYLVH